MRQTLERGSRQAQAGVALLALLTLLAMWGLYLFVGQLNATQYQAGRAQQEAMQMAAARAALLSDTLAQASIDDAAYLRLPDLGAGVGGVPSVQDEGTASPNFAGNAKDRSVIGRFPWKTLDTGALRDRYGECLWYVVSGRFKITPRSDALNWDSEGQIDLIDASGARVASKLAALLVAAGPPLAGQNRDLADPAYQQCQGNYDARNYLDPFDATHAIAGQVNYFAGSVNNRLAADSNDKSFVITSSDDYNDSFLPITVDDIFDAVIRRSDFALAIGELLDNAQLRSHLQTVVLAGARGTDNLDCRCNLSPCAAAAANTPQAAFQAFCRNWKEMLWLTALAAPEPISIDGAASDNCSRVLLFAGRRGAGQVRSTAAEKSDHHNYLEGSNAAAFSVPVAASASFAGAANFDYRTPAADLVRCLP